MVNIPFCRYTVCIVHTYKFAHYIYTYAFIAYFRDFGSPALKQRVQLLYRAHKIQHEVAMEVILEIVPVAIAGLYIVIITSFFLLARNNILILQPLFFIIGATLSIFMKIIYSLAYKVTEYSAGYLDSFIHNVEIKTQENSRFFRSCKQLDVDIGKFFKISRNTFPTVIHEIILNAIISLLLAIP
jgi:hypothetical protein